MASCGIDFNILSRSDRGKKEDDETEIGRQRGTE